jgi:hypothetical protein
MTTALAIGIFAITYTLNATELIPQVQAAIRGVAASDPDAAAPSSRAFAPGANLGGSTTPAAASANVIVAGIAAPAAVEVESSRTATHDSRRLRDG